MDEDGPPARKGSDPPKFVDYRQLRQRLCRKVLVGKPRWEVCQLASGYWAVVQTDKTFATEQEADRVAQEITSKENQDEQARVPVKGRRGCPRNAGAGGRGKGK